MSTADSLMRLCGELVRAADQGTDIFITIGEKTATTNTKARKHDHVHHFEALSGQVIGAAITVHRSLGPGFLESVYHEALRVALRHRSISFQSQVCIDTTFEGVVVGRARIDLIVGSSIVVELKATETLREIHFAQLKSYLRVTSLRIGLLLNFNAFTLTVRRLLLD